MRPRLVLGGCALLLVAGGAAVWLTADDPSPAGDGPRVPHATRSPSPSSSPTATATPTPTPPPVTGRRVAACAPGGRPGPVPSGFWGMHVTEPVGAAFPTAPPISTVNLTTSQVYWNQVETAPGGYDFARLDSILSTSDERGARPMLVLGFTPAFHAAQPESATARASMPDPAAWRAWVTAVVERYGSRLDYQVWPEPNIVGNWTGTPAQMARLTAVAGEVIHDRAPRALVVAPATTLRLPEQQRWMDRFWSTEVEGAPVADRVDAVALDPFPLEEGTPEDALALVCRAGAILADHDVDLPLWTNEINYGVASGGPDGGAEPYSDDRQAAVVARTYLLHAAMGIDRVYWLGWFSYAGLAVEMERGGVITPAGRAYAVVHDWLAGGPRPICRIDRGVHTCLVESRREQRWIHWREHGTSTVRAPDGATRVEALTGGTRRAGPGERLRVGQTPVAVVAPR